MGLEGLPLDVKEAAIEEFGEENFQTLSRALDIHALKLMLEKIPPNELALLSEHGKKVALSEFTPEERLQGLTPEQNEMYLKKIKR
jgi:hypothetical protein